PFLYPKDASEFRKQFCVGEYSAKKKDMPTESTMGQTRQTCFDWPHPGAPLREPCLSSEYADSGLGELAPSSEICGTNDFEASSTANIASCS
ncbi:unnamed protein product, partial [Durusdinium trenchii]